LRIGIFGGVFNPPHIGHLICAQEALVQVPLDVVRLVPVGRPPHRAIEDDPGAEVRFELCERAVEGDERMEVSRLELDRTGPSYTVDTLGELRARESDEDELVLILGSDQAAALPSWREPEEVLRLARLAVAEREGAAREAVVRAVERVGRGTDAVEFFDMPVVAVSSTLVRERMATGRPIRYLVPEGVAELIEARGLYTRTGVGAE
jgi:nicotinate-nucleotide adenylyltransferase